MSLGETAQLVAEFRIKDMASGPARAMTGNLNNVGKSVGAVQKNVAALGGKTSGPLGSMIGGFAGMVNPAMLGVLAIGSLTAAIGDTIHAGVQGEVSIAKLTTSLKDNVPAWDGSTAAIDNYIQSGEKLGFMADEQRQALALLLTRTHDVAKAQVLLSEAEDLARLKGMTVVDAATLIGKVYGGVFTSATRMGIAITKGSTVTQALAQIQKASAGQAEAYAKTSAGAFAAFDAEMQGLTETVGVGLLHAIGDLGTAFDQLHRFADPKYAHTQDLEAAFRTQAAAAGISADQIDAYIAAQKAAAAAAAASIPPIVRSTDAYARNRGGIITVTGAVKGLTKEEQDNLDAANAQVLQLQSQAAWLDTVAGHYGHNSDAADAYTASLTSQRRAYNTTANVIIAQSVKTEAANAALEASYNSLGTDFKATLQQMKQSAKTGLAQIRFTMHHDGSETKRILEHDMKVAVALRNKALASGNGRALAEIDAYIADVKAKMANLNMTQTIRVVTDTSFGHHVAGAGRASGGPVGGAAGSVFTVGENGKETLVMGGGLRGYVVPHSRSSATMTNINVRTTVEIAAREVIDRSNRVVQIRGAVPS